MPNWCYNRLVITGPTHERKKFLQDCFIAATTHSGPNYSTVFTFNMVMPMPMELLGTVAPRRKTVEEVRALAAVYNWPPDTTEWHIQNALTPEEAEVLDGYRLRFGADNWYDWCCTNWGTKWDAGQAVINPYNSGITITFDTAWGPPVGVIHALAAHYPNLKFRNNYTVEGERGKFVVIGDAQEYLEHAHRQMERIEKLKNEKVSA